MAALRIALSFLTRIPVGALLVDDYLAALGRAAWSFPLVGLLVGLLSWGASALAGLLFGPAVQAVVAIAALLWASGMLHLDGLMDTADAVGSVRSRERMLEIMKDSRVGAMGAAAGALSLLLRFALLLETATRLHTPALLVAPAMGRMAITLVAATWPPARPAGGLGASFARHVGRGQVAGALALGLAIAVGVAWSNPWRGLAAWVASPLLALLVGRALAAKLGGLTGDSYGAISELSEIAALAAFAALGH